MRTRSSKNGIAMTLPASTKVRKHIVCSERIKSWPTKERPRERLLAEGPARLTDAELLTITLRVRQGTFQEGVSGKSAYDTLHPEDHSLNRHNCLRMSAGFIFAIRLAMK
jgi:hypothetical protein